MHISKETFETVKESECTRVSLGIEKMFPGSIRLFFLSALRAQVAALPESIQEGMYPTLCVDW